MKIFDTILFDRELTLLEHRLAEIYYLVDVIVLVESAETFQGRPKPLHFREHQDRFAWAKQKLRPIALPRLPGVRSWDREAFQRNAIQIGLHDAQPEDIVLVLDADEIPSRALLLQLRHEGLTRPHRLDMTRHYGRLDLVSPRSACCPDTRDPFPFAVSHPRPGDWDYIDPQWIARPGVAVTMRDISGDEDAGLPPRTPHALRRESTFAPRLANAGRHLSSLTTPAELREKLSHVSHVELAEERALSLDHLARALHHRVHPRGWWYAEAPSGELPGDLARLRQKLAPQENALSSSLMRKLVRTWAWIRTDVRMPERTVRWIDRHFEWVVLPLAALLLLADGARALSAWWQRSEEAASWNTH